MFFFSTPGAFHFWLRSFRRLALQAPIVQKNFLGVQLSGQPDSALAA
jgi:hypothetical protein